MTLVCLYSTNSEVKMTLKKYSANLISATVFEERERSRKEIHVVKDTLLLIYTFMYSLSIPTTCISLSNKSLSIQSI